MKFNDVMPKMNVDPETYVSDPPTVSVAYMKN